MYEYNKVGLIFLFFFWLTYVIAQKHLRNVEKDFIYLNKRIRNAYDLCIEETL